MTKEENKKLIEEFPFLVPRNRWNGKIVAQANPKKRSGIGFFR